MTGGELLYLSREDVRALAIRPAEAREAVLAIFREHAAGRTHSLPKSALTLGPGHGFQAMTAACPARGVATLKWVAMAPVAPDAPVPGINALVLVADYMSGVPLAVLDGDEITLLRTAALSAAAASRMAPPAPRTIGFVGCGLQAKAHLDAFRDLYPSLTRVLAFSRSPASARGLAEAARAGGLAAEAVESADTVLGQGDIVISTVPGAPGLRPFLDARLMKPASFAAAVDIGRSWLPEALPAFDLLATDSLEQSQAPYDVDGAPVTTVRFSTDLVRLATQPQAAGPPRRALFCFRGFALADLAVADLIVARAREARLGQRLPR